MEKTRREFLTVTGMGLVGAAIAAETAVVAHAAGPAAAATDQQPQQVPAGMPPAFGTASPVGPEVSVGTFAEAEKLVQVEMAQRDLEQAAGSWRVNLAPLYERRVGPKKLAFPQGLAPASRWDPVLPGRMAGPARNRFVRSSAEPGPLPMKEEDIAFATVTQLSRWIETKKLTSERLTGIYLKRLEEFQPKLRCVITLDQRTRRSPGEEGG